VVCWVTTVGISANALTLGLKPFNRRPIGLVVITESPLIETNSSYDLGWIVNKRIILTNSSQLSNLFFLSEARYLVSYLVDMTLVEPYIKDVSRL
jgi:hypothetical protein